ncbi:MAG: hypothetical protein ACKOVH_02135 [Actinomycetota bacterium]|nr:hypothetical protein [Actinomycetota bacterium]
MGQAITVTSRVGSSATVRLFDCNRSLTGMAIESYGSVDETGAGRPPDVLARRLFDLGATRVSVSSSGVTVEAPESAWATLEPAAAAAIEHLFGYYGDDAGWAPDALRAIGVEPVLPPEPAGD